jgi:hypothetical protein
LTDLKRQSEGIHKKMELWKSKFKKKIVMFPLLNDFAPDILKQTKIYLLSALIVC